MRIAIVGSGISGMYAAHRLYRDHDITVFEANDDVGGHTATVDVESAGKSWAIDTGFIVFNDWTYPGFVALLEELGVAWQDSNMSFSLRCERTGLEYNGTSMNTLFAQRRNLLRPSFLRMLTEILRFNRDALRLLHSPPAPGTLGEYLQRNRYSQAFIQQYLVPMGRAIWSATEAGMLGFPADFFVRFFARHGFLSLDDRPVWRAVRDGSRAYAQKLVAPFRQSIRLRTPVEGVRRFDTHVSVRTRRGTVEHFDAVVLACHADQALTLLDDAAAAEEEILGAFAYQRNEVLLHTDTRMLPRNRRAHAAWNYHLLAPDQAGVGLTYDMNVLMSLDAPVKFLVTLNRGRDVESSKVLHEASYSHPVYTPAAVAAQQRRPEISGSRRTFYCGAYWGSGFHEDGLQSGREVHEEITRLAATADERARCA